MAALSELRRGIATPIGWLALGPVGTARAASFRARCDASGACEHLLCRPLRCIFHGESGGRTAFGARFNDAA
ncbi:hypothetical protein [Bradyrhizobium sp. 25ACV]